MWFRSKLLQCQTYFFIKSCLSHTFPRAVQSVTQTERVHLSLPIYALLFSPRLSPSCNAGMVDSCLLIQCHGLFPLSVCFDVSIQRDQWVSQRASVSKPAPDIRTQTPQSSWSFSGLSDQLGLTITVTEPSSKTACVTFIIRMIKISPDMDVEIVK